MRFRNFLLGIVVALAFTMSAQAQVEVEFWDMSWGPTEYLETAERLVAEFNEQHPDIQVNYRLIPWSNWYQTFVTAIGSGTAPDLSTGAGYQAVQLYELGAIMPIDDVIEDLRESGDLDDFFAGTVDALRYDGHYVALPWAIDIRVLYYHRGLFEEAGLEPPTNWEEFRNAAEQLTGDGVYGLVGAGDTGGTHYLYKLILNNAGGLFTEDREVNLSSERNMEAMQLLSDMVQNGWVHPASAGYNDQEARRVFIQGNAAMLILGPGLAAEFPESREIIGITEPLVGPHGDTGTINWINNIMMYQQSRNPEAAKVFLKWWSQNQLPLWTEGRLGQLPVRESFAQDPYFQEDPNLSFIIERYVPIGKTTAAHSDSIFPALNEIEGEGVMHTLVQDILQGRDLETAVRNAEARMRTMVR